ncbi:MAG: bacillithiol biosynthesis cysteine-adding enzyme BshC [Saprospiraceae bacterium]|nr:bacillithiol biosynthesis cysteine-adding enzyme BshC [Saprospiraceae bacterium]
MKKLKLNFQTIQADQLSGLSKFDLHYIYQPEALEPIIGASSYQQQITRALKERQSFQGRQEIMDLLLAQYKDTHNCQLTLDNIRKLIQPNCFTVICAHQPCIFGGPLYWIYKILSTIAYCRQLKKEYPDNEFIPIYFSGNEDHDFDEINHLYIFNKKIQWNEIPGKAVGRLTTHNLTQVIHELMEVFKANTFAQQFLEEELHIVQNSSNYASYFRHFTTKLFSNYGLIYFDPDDPLAKEKLIPILLQELSEQFIYSSTKQSSELLLQQGFQLQVNPRELNLFYHHSSGRKRIVKLSAHHFSLVDNTKTWTLDEIQLEVKLHPENFSPNVMLRPIYQEILFPNVAFIGGGAEINYWMQLYSSFAAIHVSFPALIRRHSLWYIDQAMSQKIQKSGILKLDFFKSKNELEAQLLATHENISPVPAKAFQDIEDVLLKIKQLISSLDASTQSSIAAEIQKMIKSKEHIEQKIRKYQKSKFDTELQVIYKIKDQLFPEGIPQERHFNFLAYYFQFGELYFDVLLERLEMHATEMLIAEEQEAQD